MPQTAPEPRGTVLIDTSLLVELQKKPRYSLPVKDALSGFRFKGVSSFSKLEFKRAWLQRLALLHKYCRDPGVTRIAEVLDRIEKCLSHPMQKRRVHTMLQALNAFLDLEPDKISQKAQLIRARQHFKHAVLAGQYALEEIATAVLRGTACVRAEEPARELADGSLDVTISRCKPSHIRCAIHEFFDGHREAFRAIADGVDGATMPSNELQGIRDGIRRAQENSTHLCDDRNCKAIGDAIIAVDGKNMDVYAANNDREWQLLAQVLGKRILNPVSTARAPQGE